MTHEAKWYVLQVMTGKEQEAAGRVADAGMRALAPVQVLHERRHGKWRPVRRTVFPGYVFVWADMSPRIQHYLQGLPAAHRLLGQDGPEAVPEDQMEMVLRFAPGGRDFGISRGERAESGIRITSGPLAELEDKIVKINARGRRATVEVPILGKTHRLDVGVVVTRASADDPGGEPPDSNLDKGAR